MAPTTTTTPAAASATGATASRVTTYPTQSSAALSRMVVRWFKKERGEMYTYFAVYVLALLGLYAAFRVVVWLSLSLTLTLIAGFFTYRIWTRRPVSLKEGGYLWPAIREGTFTGTDGTKLRYQYIGNNVKKVMVIANGLGGGFYFWEPIVRHFAPKGWMIVTWDYRGLFESERPVRPRRLSIRDQAEDVAQLVKAVGAESIAMFVGWSTGVQVGLEFVLLYPELVEKLVLLNGTHGHVFQTAYQPLFRVPLVNDGLHVMIEKLRDHVEHVRRLLRAVLENEWILKMWLRPYSLAFGNPNLEEFVLRYVRDLFGHSERHTVTYLEMFRELDAHSCFHLLRNIHHPVMILSGYLDILTPAYQSFEMAAQMPNCVHFCYFVGTHFMLGEYPEAVTKDMHDFADGRVGKLMQRRNSTDFTRVSRDMVETQQS